MQQKSALVTGCSSGGIGHGLAVEFAKRGIHVFATARNLSKMSDLENVPNVSLLTLDVTSSSSIAAAVAAVKDKTGGTLDYLVNNSGAVYVMPLIDSDIEKAKAMFDVNVWGLVAVTQAFAPFIIAAQGMIINVSSIATMVRAPWMSLYGASKSAMDMASETLRHEMEPLGVKVMTVVTGVVKTQIFSNAAPDPLPSDSPYKAAEEQIQKRMRGEDIFTFATVESFAQSVVNDALAGKSGHTYRAKLASLLKVLAAILPESVIDMIAKNGTGLDKVKASSVAVGSSKQKAL